MIIRMQSNGKKSIIPPIIMIAFAVYFCIIWQSGLKSADEMHEKYMPEGLTYVDATLLETKITGRGKNREYEFELEYVVNGERYTGTYSGWESETEVNKDDIFRVMIRPDDPGKIVGLSYSSGVLAGKGNDRQKFMLMLGNSMGYMGYISCGIVVLLCIRVLIKTIKYNKELEEEENAFTDPYNAEEESIIEENLYNKNAEYDSREEIK